MFTAGAHCFCSSHQPTGTLVINSLPRDAMQSAVLRLQKGRIDVRFKVIWVTFYYSILNMFLYCTICAIVTVN